MMNENDRDNNNNNNNNNRGDQNASNQAVTRQNRSIPSVDLIENDTDVAHDKDSNDDPDIVILDSNENHNNIVDNQFDNDDDISIIATREQPRRHHVVVDLDNEPELVEISNNSNNSNNIDDDLTIIEERNIPSFHINDNANLQTIPLHLPGGNSIQISINDYERPSRTSFLSGETHRHGFSDNNYRRNIFSTGERIRLIRDLENIYNRSDPDPFRTSDMRSYIMERLSNGNTSNNNNNGGVSRRRQRNNFSRNNNSRRRQSSRRLRRRLNNRYGYENPQDYGYESFEDDYGYGYESYEDEDNYGFNFGFGFHSNGATTNQRNYYDDIEERRTQNIINFIEQRENRERDIKIQQLKEKSEPLRQKYIDLSKEMEKLGQFTSNFTTFTSNEKESKDDKAEEYESVVPSCVLCGVELGVGIPDDYSGISEEDRSLTFEDLVSKYDYHCPYQSLYRPTQLDRDLSKRTFVSKNCGHLYCGRCFARIDNAKGKSKLSKKKMAELKGPSNPNNYGPRICPAENCTTIIRAKGRLKEVYF